ncbi:global DNA-binding transcriptional dual regulator H-NS [Jannaschia seosinensis]|uniref:Global DNA-binding transcriptional dual regulator H-NS n=1 Tax=Jannaschia seosinensis TaxID=313367 RepID=A0A0M7BBZ5_9RHOB|nr:H-NS histone family protein [Jannaschia seosinensis]CUH38865.1 global DNA-binding transcriptional dual regulator H-NS [Jannaschia seosinensis]
MAQLETMNMEDLAKARAETEAQLAQIKKAEAEYEGRKLQELKAEIEAMVARAGYSLADIFDGKSAKKGGKAKQPPKYRHPENKTITWSGRGRQPEWFKDALNSGKTREDLSI